MILEKFFAAKFVAGAIRGSSIYKKSKGLYVVDMPKGKDSPNTLNGAAKMAFDADDLGAFVLVSGKDIYGDGVQMRAPVILADIDRGTLAPGEGMPFSYLLETKGAFHEYWERGDVRHFTISYKPTPSFPDRTDHYVYRENLAQGTEEGEHFFSLKKNGRRFGERALGPEGLAAVKEGADRFRSLVKQEAKRLIDAFNAMQLAKSPERATIPNAVIKHYGL